MKHLLRPYRMPYTHRKPYSRLAANKKSVGLKFIALVALAFALAAGPHRVRAQAESVVQVFDDAQPLLVHSSSQGYLGVSITDVDADKAQILKLKDTHGAVITLIDHDAPAGQIGLKINDVVLAIDGVNIDTADQLRKTLRELPPGRKLSLEISRDGNIQTLAVQLAERKTLDHDIWDKIDNDGDTITRAPGMGIVSGASPDVPSTGFHLPFFGGSLNVGALVEPLTSQMADYLGIAGGLMVKQVTRKSEAATAGLRAFDVIVKVGADSINTSADWERSLRSNQGKPVAVTILRDRKQQTLTLQVDSKHHGSVDHKKLFSAPSTPLA